jgi:hypothetical protein
LASRAKSIQLKIVVLNYKPGGRFDMVIHLLKGAVGQWKKTMARIADDIMLVLSPFKLIESFVLG